MKKRGKKHRSERDGAYPGKLAKGSRSPGKYAKGARAPWASDLGRELRGGIR